MRKSKIPRRKRKVLSSNGKLHTQVTLFRPQVKDPEQPIVNDGKPPKRKPRKKFLIDALSGK